MTESRLRSMIGSGELKAGHFLIEFNTPGIGYVLKEAGCDFAVFDTEHSGYGIDTVKQVVTYMHAAALPTVVRVPSPEYRDIARVLDTGAGGVMVPMVSNLEQAKSIVQSVKYVPRGHRGVIVRAAHDQYTSGPTPEKLAKANADTVIFAQIETAEGVENVESIAALEDIDCLWVGQFDLSCSLGIPGEFDHPRFAEAINKIIHACRVSGTSLGQLAPDVSSAIELYRQGFDFIAYSADAWLWGDAVKSGLTAIRTGCQ